MHRKRYLLDREKLLFRRAKLNFWEKLTRLFLAFLISVIIALAYGIGFKHFFGSPKENRLSEQVEELKFKYDLLKRDFTSIENRLSLIAAAEDNIYRPVLDLEVLQESFRQSGYGGSKRYEELEGYENSDLMISVTRYLDEIRRGAYVQSKSFEEIIPLAEDWKNKWEHIPAIQPVRINIPLGEGVRYREKHPVLGDSRWHHGQDFSAPVGTEVYATGAGVVTKASMSPYGFGNRVEINHGYGFKSIYGHLSSINVMVGQKITRGEFIALSGNTGISSGPHLHYEIHYNGRTQNPLFFFDDDLSLIEYNEMVSLMNIDTLN